MKQMDLANALREERKSAELQPLDKQFYDNAGLRLFGLMREYLEVEDPRNVEALILMDALTSEHKCVTKLIDQRIKKIVRRAMRTARGNEGTLGSSGMTKDEKVLYESLTREIGIARSMMLMRATGPNEGIGHGIDQKEG